MEISRKGHVREIVTGLWWDGVPVGEVYLNGEKLYPIDGTVATQLLVDVTLDAFADSLNYWLHALNYRASNEDKGMPVYGPWMMENGNISDYDFAQSLVNQLKAAGWDAEIMTMYDPFGIEHYIVNKRTVSYSNPVSVFELVIGDNVYKEGGDFTINPNTGLITFTGEQMPEISALPAGAKVKLRASVPERWLSDETFHNDVWNGSNSHTYNLPILANTAFYMHWKKPAKKDTAWTIFTVTGLPSGQVYVSGHGQQNGHGRNQPCDAVIRPVQGMRIRDGNVSSVNNSWCKGDLQYRVDLKNDYGACETFFYPIYPAFTKEWDVEVLGVIIKQV